jgi:hypothetical protein
MSYLSRKAALQFRDRDDIVYSDHDPGPWFGASDDLIQTTVHER